MIVLRSLLFALVFYPLSLGYVLWALAGSLSGRDAVRAAAHGWAVFHRRCASAILGIRSRVEGNIPEGPVLFAIKHESMYETIEMLLVIRDPVVLLKKELADLPLWGRVARMHGAIAVDRDGGARALRQLVREAREAAARNRPLVLFPEGTRVPHGTAPPLRAGFAGLYRHIGLPVVPVAVDSGRLWPRRGFLKRPGVVTFRFGEAVPPGLDRETAERIVHAEINRLNG